MREPEQVWSLDVKERDVKWRPRTFRARMALAAINSAYALKSRSYKAYLRLARSRRLGRLYVHAPFEVLYSIVYRALRTTAFPGSSVRRPS